MTEQPVLSDAEWALIMDLLKIEQDDLPVEIRHARNGPMREELHQRKQMVDQLLQRLVQHTAPAVV
jgi:hypothetical protein